MENMTLSPQSQSVYKILLNCPDPLSAKEIGKQMRIPPQLVYRLTEELTEIGIVTRLPTYPFRFQAKSSNEGLSLFLLSQHEWFSKNFGSKQNNSDSQKSKEIQFSFIQSRDELMNEAAKEISNARKTVDLLRSGHEISAEVMLSIKEAQKRNVRIRMLIQDYSRENRSQVEYWKVNGIEVKKTKFHHIRLMLYDSSIIYFMSYKHEESEKDLGMKIHYPPFASILSQLFNTWWQEGENL
jgi:sugar-specific transcriptional regulator TrmB